MKSAVREHLTEAGVGLAGVLAALWFLFLAIGRTGGAGGDMIRVNALFPAANEFRSAPMSGSPASRSARSRRSGSTRKLIRPRSFWRSTARCPCRPTAARRSPVKACSAAAMSRCCPAGAESKLKDGDTILETQGSVDMMSLVGSVINRSTATVPPLPRAMDLADGRGAPSVTRMVGAAVALLLLAGCGGPSVPEPQRKQKVEAEPEPETVDIPQTVTTIAPGTTPMAQRTAVVGLPQQAQRHLPRPRDEAWPGARVGDVVVRLRACETTAPWEVQKLTGAFVQLDVRNPQGQFRRVFSGWLYKETLRSTSSSTRSTMSGPRAAR
jgi:hypothetical protein